MLTILQGDALARLRELPDESVQCCVTSPPYWGLRDYGVEGQIGLESTPEEFIARLVEVFEEVRRVLKRDGTCWVNMGDCYETGTNASRGTSKTAKHGYWNNSAINLRVSAGLKPKDLVGQPWMLAFALRGAGWYLRSDIIWSKPNPMPESCKDRPTKSHEYLFLLTKSQRYYYDYEAILEPVTGGAHARGGGVNPKAIAVPGGWATGSGSHSAIDHSKPGGSYKGSVPGRMNGPGQERRSKNPRQNASFSAAVTDLVELRNKRSVWNVAPFAYAEAHFATFPPDLIKPCILAGSRPGDMVLDPFGGSGTTGQVALELGRRATLIELNPEYVKLIERRTSVTLGLGLATEAAP